MTLSDRLPTSAFLCPQQLEIIWGHYGTLTALNPHFQTAAFKYTHWLLIQRIWKPPNQKRGTSVVTWRTVTTPNHSRGQGDTAFFQVFTVFSVMFLLQGFHRLVLYALENAPLVCENGLPSIKEQEGWGCLRTVGVRLGSRVLSMLLAVKSMLMSQWYILRGVLKWSYRLISWPKLETWETQAFISQGGLVHVHRNCRLELPQIIRCDCTCFYTYWFCTLMPLTMSLGAHHMPVYIKHNRPINTTLLGKCVM